MVKLFRVSCRVWGGDDGLVYLGLVVEMCEGGTLREALEADDYATAIDEAQRRALAPGRRARHGVFVFQGRGASRPQGAERPPRRLAGGGAR